MGKYIRKEGAGLWKHDTLLDRAVLAACGVTALETLETDTRVVVGADSASRYTDGDWAEWLIKKGIERQNYG